MSVVTEFTDEWGEHIHESVGSPYDHNKKVTCTGCLNYLNTKADEWQRKFAIREGHNPDTFWIGYKRIWED